MSTTATPEQAQRVLNLITQKEVSSEHLQWLLEGGFFADLLEVSGDLKRNEFRQFLKLDKLHLDLMELPGIVIPDDATVKTLKAKGKYDSQTDFAKRHLTDKRFQVTVHGPRRLLMARFKKGVTSKYVESVAEEMGYSVGLVEDFLCVGAHPEHRKLQRQFPVIALGSSVVVRSNRLVPYSCFFRGGRHLSLGLHDDGWCDGCGFLFIGKSSVVA